MTEDPSVRRRRLRSAAAGGLLVSVLLGAATSCASATPDRSQVVSALRTSGIPATQARCATDAIYDNLSDAQVRQLIDRGSGGTPKDDPTRTDDALDKLNAAMATCRDLATPTTTERPAGGTVTTTTEGASFDTAPGSGDSTTSAPAVGSTDAPSPTATSRDASTTS